MFFLLPLSCISRPATLDLTSIVAAQIIASIPYGQCLFVGRSGTVANSGVLACSAFDNFNCSRTLFPNTSSARTQITTAINSVGQQYSNCLAAAGNALTEINSLTLPGYYYMNKAGGTTGPHTQSAYYASSLTDCASIGMNETSFLGGAQRLATSDELGFLSTASGLVALRDLGGSCRSQMGLTASQDALVSSVQNNQVARSASCDYGANDATKTDCPANLQNTNYMFSGITTW